MNIQKSINLRKVYSILNEMISNPEFSAEDRLLLYRFLDKLSDTDAFENVVNRKFSIIKRKSWKSAIEKCITDRSEIVLKCGFCLLPSGVSNWELYLNNELFLDQLDKKIAYNIAMDINVAFLIKSSRDSRFSEDNKN